MYQCKKCFANLSTFEGEFCIVCLPKNKTGQAPDNDNLGPVYEVPLDFGPLPVGDMMQAMPNERDLHVVRAVNERAAAGYEVLLHHHRKLLAAVKSLREHHEMWRDRFHDSYKAAKAEGETGDEHDDWCKYERECAALDAMSRLGIAN